MPNEKERLDGDAALKAALDSMDWLGLPEKTPSGNWQVRNSPGHDDAAVARDAICGLTPSGNQHRWPVQYSAELTPAETDRDVVTVKPEQFKWRPGSPISTVPACPPHVSDVGAVGEFRFVAVCKVCRALYEPEKTAR